MIFSASRGSSFSSAVAYVTHDKGADTSERVGFVQLENIAFDPREMEITHQAAKMLQARTREQDGKRAGASGREIERPVYHLSLSWHPDEKPSTEHMLETAREVLRLLGLQDHQAVIAQHVERPHSHLHVVASLIHPDTGRVAPLSYDHTRLTKWAHQYEQRQAMIRVPKRESARTPNPELRREKDKLLRELNARTASRRIENAHAMDDSWKEFYRKRDDTKAYYGHLIKSVPALTMHGPNLHRTPEWMKLAQALKPYLERIPEKVRRGFDFWKPDFDIWTPDRRKNRLGKTFDESKHPPKLSRLETMSLRRELKKHIKAEMAEALTALALELVTDVKKLDVNNEKTARDYKQQLKGIDFTAIRNLRYKESQKNKEIAEEPVREEFQEQVDKPADRKQYKITRLSREDAEIQFRDFLHANGIHASGPLVEGVKTSAKVHGSKENGKASYTFYENGDGTFGGSAKNHKTDRYATFRPQGERVAVAPEERDLFSKQAAERSAAKEAEKVKTRENTAREANIRWKDTQPASREHPYLQAKGISSVGFRQNKEGQLVSAMYNKEGRIVNLQTIAEDGEKRFMKGGQKQETCHVIADISAASRIIVCEGRATANTLYMATGACVVTAWDAGNLKDVAKMVRAVRPDAEITIASDNDHHLTEQGKENIGIEKAQEAAKEIGADFAIPPAGDWNDLARESGIEAVRSAFDHSPPSAPAHTHEMSFER